MTNSEEELRRAAVWAIEFDRYFRAHEYDQVWPPYTGEERVKHLLELAKTARESADRMANFAADSYLTQD